MFHGSRFLFKNGVVSAAADAPSVAEFLELNPGAYTTTRTDNNGTEILFWERHLNRLSDSFKLLLKENPKLLLEKPDNLTSPFRELSNHPMMWDSVIRPLANDSMRKAMPFVAEERKIGEELSITTLVSGNHENLGNWKGSFDEGRVSELLDVYLHIGGYVPPSFGGNAARLAVVGRGRDFANAKYSDWVRLRKPLEKLRPPSVTELLLSNDGERILEGSLANFFVVCFKEKDGGDGVVEENYSQSLSSIEVQTAPLNDGVLPGVIQQVIKEICLNIGIPYREVAPLWSQRDLWLEAFITNSLRILQHVETIQAPTSWKSIESSTWEEITWVEKRFEDGPGAITSMIHREILVKTGIEAFPVGDE